MDASNMKMKQFVSISYDLFRSFKLILKALYQYVIVGTMTYSQKKMHTQKNTIKSKQPQAFLNFITFHVFPWGFWLKSRSNMGRKFSFQMIFLEQNTNYGLKLVLHFLRITWKKKRYTADLSSQLFIFKLNFIQCVPRESVILKWRVSTTWNAPIVNVNA